MVVHRLCTGTVVDRRNGPPAAAHTVLDALLVDVAGVSEFLKAGADGVAAVWA